MERILVVLLLLGSSALQAQPTHNTTEVEPFLIVATRSNLMKINLNGSRSTLYKLQTPAVALDFDYQQQMIYWAEGELSANASIRRMHISGSDVQVLHNTLISDPYGLAVDWVAGNLYWCDMDRKTIEVSKLDGSHRTVLVNTGLDRPLAMTVDVRNGYLYWSDFSRKNPNKARIERMGMDGTNRTVVKDKLSFPFGLALDYSNDHIYWSNGGESIESANLDGTNRHTLVSQEDGITRITVFEDHLYWAYKYSCIYRADKTHGTNQTKLFSDLHETRDLLMYHPSRQPEVSGHPCQTNNGGCSHLCLLSPGGGYKCSCPTNSYRSADNKQCMMSSCTASQFVCKNLKCIPLSWKCDTVDDCGDRSDEPEDCSLPAKATHNATEVEPFLIVATRYNLMKINLNGSSSTELKQSGVWAVDFDQQQMIYWTEWDHAHQIRRMHISGRGVQVLHNTLIHDPSGLAVDWVAGNLYWCDSNRKTIEVSKLDGSHRTVLVNTSLEEPLSMAVDVRYGYLYWTDRRYDRIERMGMDGTNRTVILKDKISVPDSLTLDYSKDHIYWVNKGTSIEFANLDGTNRHTIVSRRGHINHFTLFEDHIYWEDDGSIYRANKTDGTNQAKLISNLGHINDLLVYHPSRHPEVSGHPCQTNNGGCSRLCLLSPGGGYKCSCSLTRQLQ